MPLVQNRSYTLRTTRLLSEYLAANYPQYPRFFEFRLGALNPATVASLGPGVSPRIALSQNKYVDAVVVLPAEIQLWEAKRQVDAYALGQLTGYGSRAPHTPGWAKWAGRAITLHLLAAYDDAEDHALATSMGIDVVIYAPAWFTASQMSAAAAGAARNRAASKG